MFEKLDGIVERYSEIMEQLNDPNVVNNQENFRKLMKEQSDLALHFPSAPRKILPPFCKKDQ